VGWCLLVLLWEWLWSRAVLVVLIGLGRVFPVGGGVEMGFGMEVVERQKR